MMRKSRGYYVKDVEQFIIVAKNVQTRIGMYTKTDVLGIDYQLKDVYREINHICLIGLDVRVLFSKEKPQKSHQLQLKQDADRGSRKKSISHDSIRM